MFKNSDVLQNVDQQFAGIFSCEWCKGVTKKFVDQMLQNEYLFATIGADTAENEPSKVRSFG